MKKRIEKLQRFVGQAKQYRVRSHLRRRRHYFMYNQLDDAGEVTQYKRRRNNSSSAQGLPVEH